MAIQQVTEPVILDETGLRIEQRLAEIKNALQPTNACIDIDISLPTTGWTGNGPYTYTYNNAHITTGCKVKVNFLETESASGGILYLEYEKVVGGVQFTAKSVPTTSIPVRIHILNADAESIMATTADEVSTNAVTGASNVEQALGIVNDNVAEVNDKVGNVPEGETVERQITSLNSKIANLITTQSFTITISESVAAGATKSYGSDVTKSGYTPLGVIQQFGSGTGSFAFQDYYIEGNSLVVYVRNVSSSAATLNYIKVVVIYKKN